MAVMSISAVYACPGSSRRKRRTSTIDDDATSTDGTPVEFVSCHRCEHKIWVDASGVQHRELPVASVLDKTRKPR